MRNTKAERVLSRLEKKYDKRAAPTREYYHDLREIQGLQKDGVIDAEHASILIDGAKAHRKATEDARKPKRVLTPIGAAMRPKAPLRGAGGAVDMTVDAATAVMRAAFAFIGIAFLFMLVF